MSAACSWCLRDHIKRRTTQGKKTWAPGKNLQKFIAANFGIQPKEQLAIVESISDAVADVAAAMRQAIKLHDGFDDIGKRMLLAWADGVRGLRNEGGLPTT